LLPAIALGLLSIAFAAGRAHAGILQVTISEGATSYVILDQGPLDLLTGAGNTNKIQADAAALIFPDYKIIGLNAATNNPGSSIPGIGADLTIGGEVQKITLASGPDNPVDPIVAGPDGSILDSPADTFGPSGPPPLIITATDTDYFIPPGGVLQSSMSTTDTAVPAGDTRTFESWFNPSNVLYANDIPQGAPVPLSYASTGLALNSNGATASPQSVPASAPYGLTNTTIINLTGATTGADLLFGGTTVVLVPEPAAIGTIALAAALLLFARRPRSSANV
jgi:hypothetical protein